MTSLAKLKNQTVRTSNYQKNLTKKYRELFRFVEKTGEEVFVFPKEYKVGISLKPANILREEFETKDALDKIQRGQAEHQKGKSEKMEDFLKKKYPQYVKTFSNNS